MKPETLREVKGDILAGKSVKDIAKKYQYSENRIWQVTRDVRPYIGEEGRKQKFQDMLYDWNVVKLGTENMIEKYKYKNEVSFHVGISQLRKRGYKFNYRRKKDFGRVNVNTTVNE